jgi:hypothetical protein
MSLFMQNFSRTEDPEYDRYFSEYVNEDNSIYQY